MNKEYVKKILKELHLISGFKVSLHTTTFDEIAAYPEGNCSFCTYIHEQIQSECSLCEESCAEGFRKAANTGETIIRTCRHGLIEIVNPLYNFGILTGFLKMGQARALCDDISGLLKVLKENGKSDFEAREIISAIPTVEENMIKPYADITAVCASYLTLSSAVTSSKASIGQLTMRFIRDHFTEKISVMDICKAVGYSKSTVLAAFKKEFSTTVNAYLNTLRLEKAKTMLENENTSVNEIALSCGFADQSYFSKVFSSAYGITPTEFRRVK